METPVYNNTQVEYMSLSDAKREAIARQRLFDDLHIVTDPMLHSDNQAPLSIAQNPVQYQRSKHIGTTSFGKLFKTIRPHSNMFTQMNKLPTFQINLTFATSTNRDAYLNIPPFLHRSRR
jgi:hypothetical protein